MENKNLNYKFLIVMAIFVALGSMGGKYIMDLINKKTNSFDKQLVEAANEINKNTPIMMDSETRLDTTMALPNNGFMYVFTLINISKDELDLELLENEIRPMMLNNLKTNSGLDDFRKNNVTMVYTYRDKDGYEILKLSFNADEYK